MDVFVNDFLGLAQGHAHRRRQVQKKFIHSLDKMFWPYKSGDSDNHKEVLLLKKLREGECTWPTCQVLLGWVIDMVNMALSLPPHQENRFKHTPDGITTSQNRIDVGKWYWVIGQLRFMSIALPGAWGLFSHIQVALCHVERKSVALTSGVH